MTDNTFLQFIETYSVTRDHRKKSLRQLLGASFREYPANSVINHQRESGDDVIYVINSGWGKLYRDLHGGDRQTIDTPVRGDIVWQRPETANTTFSAITDLYAIEIQTPSLEQAMEQDSKLSRLFIRAIARQNAISAEHLVNAGRRNAMTRISHFLLELEERLSVHGLNTDGGYECPLTQHELADILGLTKIHVNRTLSALRTNGLATFKSGFVEILDRKRLVSLTDFDKAYLRQRG